jgi:hypothetical protein
MNADKFKELDPVIGRLKRMSALDAGRDASAPVLEGAGCE